MNKEKLEGFRRLVGTISDRDSNRNPAKENLVAWRRNYRNVTQEIHNRRITNTTMQKKKNLPTIKISFSLDGTNKLDSSVPDNLL